MCFSFDLIIPTPPRLPSKSTIRARSSSRDQNDPAYPPLVSCIVDHDHPRRMRRPSLPVAPKFDVVTVPLRECCLKCHPVTEESLMEGSAWQEKFSKGARRRRNSSADAYPVQHRRVNEDIPGFESILNVDEVDKRRRSRDFSDVLMPMNEISLNDPEDEAANSELGLLPSLTRQKLHISTTTSSTSNTKNPPSLMEEDEEDQLFPLPSPRRTPNGSPLPSPLATPSSSTTNLAKTVLGQKSSQNANTNASGSSGSLPPRERESPNLLAVPLRREDVARMADMDAAREIRERFEEISALMEMDSVPDLTWSPSPSPDLSLLPASPNFQLPPTPHTHTQTRPIAIRKAKSSPPPAYTTSPMLVSSTSPSPSPQLRHRERGSSLSGGMSVSPSQSIGWRKLHLAGSLLKAGADVLKGVNSMGGGVAV